MVSGQSIRNRVLGSGIDDPPCHLIFLTVLRPNCVPFPLPYPPVWFADSLADFGGDSTKVPTDHHQLLGMVSSLVVTVCVA